ncbi:hypothetical protein LLB_2756 [Legionella longbeachae D-4968]|nr:hypothetical protein LLB_2756 [Legionella longbeachae D-4968]
MFGDCSNSKLQIRTANALKYERNWQELFNTFGGEGARNC